MPLMVTLLFPKLLQDTLPFSCSSDVVEFPQIPQIFPVFAPDYLSQPGIRRWSQTCKLPH